MARISVKDSVRRLFNIIVRIWSWNRSVTFYLLTQISHHFRPRCYCLLSVVSPLTGCQSCFD